MNRRVFLGVLAGGLLALPLAALAQQTGQVYRVGVVLEGGPYYAAIDGLRAGLKELGFEEGRQYVLHIRDVKGDLSAVAETAKNLEQEKVDLIYTTATSVTLAVRRGTCWVRFDKELRQTRRQVHGCQHAGRGSGCEAA